MGIFNKNKDEDQSGLNVIDSQEGAFDSTSQSLDTITELTDDSDNNSQEHPYDLSEGVPVTTEDTTSTVKKNKLKPIIMVGAGVLAAGILGYAILGGDDIPPENTNQVENSASKEQATPELPTLSSDNAASEAVEEEKNEVGNDKMLDASQPLNVKENNDELNLGETNTQASDVIEKTEKTEEQKIDKNQNVPSENKDISKLGGENISNDTPQVNKNETIKTEQSQTITQDAPLTNNIVVGNGSPEELRMKAQELLKQAEILENQNKIDALLVGKTPDEQISILKMKLAEYEKAIIEKGQSCSQQPQKKNNQRNRVRKNRMGTNIRALPSAGIVEGQVWFKNGNSVSQPYVVGDKLPNGAVIKSINSDTKTVNTNKGTFKLN